MRNQKRDPKHQHRKRRRHSPSMKNLEFHCLEVRTEKEQQEGLDLLDKPESTIRRQRQIQVQGFDTVRKAERIRVLANDSGERAARKRVLVAARDKRRTDNRSGFHQKDETPTGLLEYHDAMQDILRGALLKMFQYYAPTTKHGIHTFLPRQTLMQLLRDLLQVVGPHFGISEPTSQNHKIQYREPGFVRAINEALDVDPNDHRRLKVKQEHLDFVTEGSQQLLYGIRVKEKIQEVVRRVVDGELNGHRR